MYRVNNDVLDVLRRKAWNAQRTLSALPAFREYKELMAITVALTTQCVYCIEVHRQEALKTGATEQELAEAVSTSPLRFVPLPPLATALISSKADPVGTRL